MPYSSFDRTYDTSFMVDQAMSVGRAPNFIQQIQEQLRVLFNGVDVSPQVTFDSETLADKVAAIAGSAQKDPINAALTRVDGKYVVTPAQTGLSVDANGAVADAVAAVNNTSTADSSITVQTSTVPPVISTDQAQAAADTFERVVGSGRNHRGRRSVDPDHAGRAARLGLPPGSPERRQLAGRYRARPDPPVRVGLRDSDGRRPNQRDIRLPERQHRGGAKQGRPCRGRRRDD